MRVWQITNCGFIKSDWKVCNKEYAENANCVSFTPFKSPVVPEV